MATPETLENPVHLAVIGAAQGLRGEVRVKTFTGDPMALGDYGPLHTGDGHVLTVKTIRMAKTVAVVRFAEVADRNAAEALNGVTLFVDRSALPTELEDEEYYHADLIDLIAVDETGARVGKVNAVHNFGAGDVLEIARSRGGPVMVPFSRAAVPKVELAAGLIHLDGRAAGLVEDDEAAEEKE